MRNEERTRDTLLSIHPKYAEAILAGTKRYEFRRVIPAQPVDRMFLYATSPVGKVVGYFRPGLIVHATTEDIWKMCRSDGMLTKNEFLGYFREAPRKYAIEIRETYAFVHAKELPNKNPPMNFRYVSEEEAEYFVRT